MDKLLTPKEVSEILRVKERTVKYTLNLPYIKVSGKRMYQRKDIENFINKNKHYTIDIIAYQKTMEKAFLNPRFLLKAILMVAEVL